MAISIPGFTQGTAPGWFTQKSMGGLVRTFFEKYLNSNPLLLDFRTQVHDSEKILIEEIVKVLQVGTLTARPQPGRRLDPTMFSQKLVELFYDQYVTDLTGAEYLSLADPENAAKTFGPSTLEAAVRKMRGHFAIAVETYLRTLHYAVAKMMSTQGPATLNISGVDVEYDYGFKTADFSADWATVTTDIQSEFSDMLAKFRRQSRGRNPNRLYISDQFVRMFIMRNQTLRDDFLPRSTNIMKDWITALQLPASDRETVNGLQVRYISDVVVEETPGNTADGDMDDFTDQWPLNIMTLAYHDSEDENFIMNTAKTLENGMRGGFGYNVFERNDPLNMAVRFSGNNVPSWSDGSKVMVCKVSDTTSVTYPADA